MEVKHTIHDYQKNIDHVYGIPSASSEKDRIELMNYVENKLNDFYDEYDNAKCIYSSDTLYILRVIKEE